MHFIFIACNKNKKAYRTDPSFIYRCENLALGLQSHQHTTEYVHLKEFSFFKKMDVVVFHRPKFSLRLWLVIQFLRSKKIFFMLDVDDFIFDTNFAHESPAFKNNILSLKKIKKQFSNNFRAFQLFTNFSVSTQPIQKHLLRIIPYSSIIILPNSVHPSWLNLKNQKKDFSKKIISYFPGTKSHDKDFQTIQEPLTKFLQKHPNILLKITGPLNFQIDIPQQQLLYNKKVPFNQHWKNYQNIWINLAPLETSIFNQSKSALKVIEAGFFNTPTISINNPDTQRFINKGALIIHKKEDVYDYLEKCLHQDYYERVTKNLQDKILEISDNYISAQKLIQFITQHKSITYARQRRQDGLYDHTTLRFYIMATLITKNLDIYVEYCMFCRDLGYFLSARRKKILQKTLSKLKGKSEKNAKLLLMETNNIFKSNQQYLNTIFNNQNQWYDSLTTHIQNKTICVVGNSANIRNKKLGKTIDKHDIVLRFNNCCSNQSYLDLGEKTTIWISAPNIKKIVKSPWIIISGPNMIYRGAQWKRFSTVNFDKTKILNVPLEIWKELISILHAPPSAGILMLYWLRKISLTWNKLSIIGFDFQSKQKIYHFADNSHKAGTRHNWKKEKELIREWTHEGLKVIE